MTGHNRVKYLTRLDTFFSSLGSRHKIEPIMLLWYKVWEILVMRKIEFTAGINFSVLRLAIKIVWNGSHTADNDTKIMSNFYNSNSPPW